MNQDQIKQNLLSTDTWLRILFMAGFALAVWITMLVLAVIVVFQLIIVLITSTPNANLQYFGLRAGAYLFETIQFLLYNTDDKPFPFAPFPDPEGDGEESCEHHDHDDEHDDTPAQANSPAHGSPEPNNIPTLDSTGEDEQDQDFPK